MRPRSLRIVPLALVLLGTHAGPATAARPLEIRDVGPAPAHAVADDRSLATVATRTVTLRGTEDGPVTVVDLVTRHIDQLASPAGCSLVAIRAGRILWTCAGPVFHRGFLLDLTSRRGTTLDALGGVPAFSPGSVTFVGLGRHWAVARVGETGRALHVDPVNDTVNPATVADRRHVLDPDRATLVRRLCRPMVTPLVPSPRGEGLEAGPLRSAPGVAVATTWRTGERPLVGRVVIHRCGRKPLVLDRCAASRPCTQPVFDGRRMAWLQRATRSDRLHVHDLRTGARRSVRIVRGAHGPAELVALVRGRLFVTAGARLIRVTGI